MAAPPGSTRLRARRGRRHRRDHARRRGPARLGRAGGVAVTYAKKNALNGQGAAQICLSGSACPTWHTGQTCRAMPTPPAGTFVGNYVEVRTTTVTSSGSNLVPPVFAGTLPGMAGYKGSQVGTCARVNWGPPADPGRVFSMGISYCTQPAPLGNPSQARGYAWLASTDGTPPDSNCMIDTAVGDYPESSLIILPPVTTYCANKLAAARASGQPLLVPIFDVIQQALLSATPAYHIVGFAPFVVTGYRGLLGGLLGGVGSLLSGAGLAPAVATILCGASNCVYGYFTKTLVPESHATFGTGANYGATVISRTR